MNKNFENPYVKETLEVIREMVILGFAVFMFVVLMIAMMPITAAIWPFY